MVRRVDHARQRPFAEPEAVEQLGALVRRELRGLSLELHARGEHLGRTADLRDDRRDRRVGLVELVFAEVHDDQHRLRGDEEERLERGDLVGGQPRAVERHRRLQEADRLLEDRDLTRDRLVELRRLAPPFELRLGARGICEHELELERRQVVERVAAADDVRVDEGSKHVQHGVDLADAAEELVAQPLARVRALLDAGDVDELCGRVDDLLRLAHRGERVEALVRHLRDTHVRLGRRERMRCDLRVAAGQRVEEG